MFAASPAGGIWHGNATGRILTTIDAGGTYRFVYNSAGNTVLFYQSGGSSALNDRASWYGADGQLRVAE
jgi:hypothetical protein